MLTEFDKDRTVLLQHDKGAVGASFVAGLEQVIKVFGFVMFVVQGNAIASWGQRA